MVSVGTILTLGIVAAVAAGGYALYANAGKIGGAVTRGVETTLTNPLGNYLDSLFSNSSSASEAIINTAVSTVQKQITDAIQPKSKTQPTPNPTPIVIPGQIPVTTTIGRTTETRPSTVSPAGYYYFNVAGSKYDTQQLLKAGQGSLYQAAALKDPALLNVTYLGKSKLGQSAFNLFGQSKNYL